MKKIMIFLVAAVVMFSSCIMVSAERTAVEYKIAYEEGRAIISYYADTISSFDFGFIYDPEELTVESVVFSEAYDQLASDKNYTTLEISNEEAKDDEGNTYVVVTGAVLNNKSTEPTDFGGQEIAHIIVTGVDEGDVIGVVSETASVKDVRNANKIAAVDLGKQQEVTDSDIFAGAKEEPEDNAGGDNNGAAANNSQSEENNSTWMYVLVIAAVIIIVAVLIVISKKGHAAIEESEPETPEETQDE